MSAYQKTDKVQYPEFSIHKRSAHQPCRDSKEVAAMFGYKSAQTLVNDVHRGKFPPPDLVTGMTTKKLFWQLSTIEKEKRRREL